MNKYYLFYQTEDGLTIIEGTKQEMEKELSEMEESLEDSEFDDEFPKYRTSSIHIDLDEFRGPVLIEGHIVIPKKVEVVTKYEL